MGHQYASTVVFALDARSAVVHQYASTVVYALNARSAVGHRYASTVVSAIGARSAAGVQSASTVVSAEDARSAGRTNDIGSKTPTLTLMLLFVHVGFRASFHARTFSAIGTRALARLELGRTVN